LRGELTQLKRAADEKQTTKAKNNLGEYTPPKDWQDAGAANPQAAVETILWAAKTGNDARINEMIQWQVMGIPDVNHVDFNSGEAAPKVIKNVKDFVGNLQGAKIIGAEPLSESGVNVRLELTDADSKKQVQEIIMARQDSGWKIAMTVTNGQNPNEPIPGLPLTASLRTQ
jgi:hypothetical protein